MSRANIYSAIDYVMDHILYVKPSNEEDAMEAAYEALHEYIDSALTYTSDILDLWDGGTHENVDLASCSSLMEAVTASTYFQLSDDWDYATLDGIDKAICSARGGEDHHAYDRDYLLAELWA